MVRGVTNSSVELNFSYAGLVDNHKEEHQSSVFDSRLFDSSSFAFGSDNNVYLFASLDSKSAFVITEFVGLKRNDNSHFRTFDIEVFNLIEGYHRSATK